MLISFATHWLARFWAGVTGCIHKKKSSAKVSKEEGLEQALLGQDGSRSMRAYAHGLNHWAYARISDWSKEAPPDTVTVNLCGSEHDIPNLQAHIGEERPRCFNPFADLWKSYILGVGLPLFYNFHILPLLTSMLVSCFCYNASMSQGDDADFATRMMIGMAIVWVLMVFVCCVRSRRVDNWAKDFNRKVPSMDDFGVWLHGLPSYHTNEKELLDLMQSTWDNHLKRPLMGVSIGYNLQEKGIPTLDAWSSGRSCKKISGWAMRSVNMAIVKALRTKTTI
jgi:hypothetical protein